MDPLSIVGAVASISQIAALAKDIVGNMWQYFEAVKNAPKHSKELRREMAALSELLDGLEEELNPKSMFATSAPFEDFCGMLNHFKTRVAVAQTQGIGRLKWPFNDKENKYWLDKIERYKLTFSLALNVQVAYENRRLRQDVKIVVDDVQFEKRKKVLEWISPIDFSSQHEKLRSVRVSDSGRWFLESTEFIDWVDSHDATSLLLSGIRMALYYSSEVGWVAGAGKSFLMSAAIDVVKDRTVSKNAKVIYIYFDYKSQISQTTAHVAKTLLKQLLSSSGLPPEIETLYDDHVRGNYTPNTATWIKHLKEFSHCGPIYAFFDGVDECSEDHLDQTFSLLVELQESGYRLLLSTRPHLVPKLRERINDLRVRDIVADKSDLRTYILFRLRKAGNTNSELEGKCLNLIKGVQGMFLLAKFQLDHVLGCRQPIKRLKAVATVPVDLHSAYYEILQRIESSQPGDKDLAMKVLSWLYRAQRPLRMEELLEALAVDEGELDATLDDIVGNKLLPSDLLECCKSLVQHDEPSGIIRFVHFTVQEFIAQHVEMLPSVAHLSKTCLTCIAISRLQPVTFRYVRHKLEFTRYALKYWLDHTKGEAEDCFEVQMAFLSAFLSAFEKPFEWKEVWMHLRMSQINNLRQDEVPEDILHLIALVGLAKLGTQFLNGSLSNWPRRDQQMPMLRNINPLLRNKYGLTALHMAAGRGHEEILDSLIISGAQVNCSDIEGCTALHHSARYKHRNIVERLLRRDARAEIDANDNQGRTALHLAARSGSTEIVGILLRATADVTIRDVAEGRTALHDGASGGHAKIVEMLLANAAPVNVIDNHGMTPLHMASAFGNEQIVGLLLSAGANVNVSDMYERTPLLYAALIGSNRIVAMLLTGGAKANVQDNEGWSVLHNASLYGHVEIIEMALRAGANGNFQNNIGWTALHYSSQCGHYEAVQTIIKAGVDVNIPGRDGWTALHSAANYGYATTVKLLLDAGAVVSLQTKDGKTTLNLAETGGYQELADILKPYFVAC